MAVGEMVQTWIGRLTDLITWSLTKLWEGWSFFWLLLGFGNTGALAGPSDRDQLLTWAGQQLGIATPENFGTDWSDGVLLLRLVHALTSTPAEELAPGRPIDNINTAFRRARQLLGQPPTVSVTEVISGRAERRLAGYVDALRAAASRRWPADSSGDPPESVAAEGDGLAAARCGQTAQFVVRLPPAGRLDLLVEMRSEAGEYFSQRLTGRSPPRRRLEDAAPAPAAGSARPVSTIPVGYHISGRTVTLCYRPQAGGTLLVTVVSQGAHVDGSPFLVQVAESESPTETVQPPRPLLRPLSIVREMSVDQEEPPREALIHRRHSFEHVIEEDDREASGNQGQSSRFRRNTVHGSQPTHHHHQSVHHSGVQEPEFETITPGKTKEASFGTKEFTPTEASDTPTDHSDGQQKPKYIENRPAIHQSENKGGSLESSGCGQRSSWVEPTAATLKYHPSSEPNDDNELMRPGSVNSVTGNEIITQNTPTERADWTNTLNSDINVRAPTQRATPEPIEQRMTTVEPMPQAKLTDLETVHKNKEAERKVETTTTHESTPNDHREPEENDEHSVVRYESLPKPKVEPNSVTSSEEKISMPPKGKINDSSSEGKNRRDLSKSSSPGEESLGVTSSKPRRKISWQERVVVSSSLDEDDPVDQNYNVDKLLENDNMPETPSRREYTRDPLLVRMSSTDEPVDITAIPLSESKREVEIQHRRKVSRKGGYRAGRPSLGSYESLNSDEDTVSDETRICSESRDAVEQFQMSGHHQAGQHQKQDENVEPDAETPKSERKGRKISWTNRVQVIPVPVLPSLDEPTKDKFARHPKLMLQDSIDEPIEWKHAPMSESKKELQVLEKVHEENDEFASQQNHEDDQVEHLDSSKAIGLPLDEEVTVSDNFQEDDERYANIGVVLSEAYNNKVRPDTSFALDDNTMIQKTADSEEEHVSGTLPASEWLSKEEQGKHIESSNQVEKNKQMKEHRSHSMFCSTSEQSETEENVFEHDPKPEICVMSESVTHLESGKADSEPDHEESTFDVESLKMPNTNENPPIITKYPFTDRQMEVSSTSEEDDNDLSKTMQQVKKDVISGSNAKGLASSLDVAVQSHSTESERVAMEQKDSLSRRCLVDLRNYDPPSMENQENRNLHKISQPNIEYPSTDEKLRTSPTYSHDECSDDEHTENDFFSETIEPILRKESSELGTETVASSLDVVVQSRPSEAQRVALEQNLRTPTYNSTENSETNDFASEKGSVALPIPQVATEMVFADESPSAGSSEEEVSEKCSIIAKSATPHQSFKDTSDYFRHLSTSSQDEDIQEMSEILLTHVRVRDFESDVEESSEFQCPQELHSKLEKKSVLARPEDEPNVCAEKPDDKNFVADLAISEVKGSQLLGDVHQLCADDASFTPKTSKDSTESNQSNDGHVVPYVAAAEKEDIGNMNTISEGKPVRKYSEKYSHFETPREPRYRLQGSQARTKTYMGMPHARQRVKAAVFTQLPPSFVSARSAPEGTYVPDTVQTECCKSSANEELVDNNQNVSAFKKREEALSGREVKLKREELGVDPHDEDAIVTNFSSDKAREDHGQVESDIDMMELVNDVIGRTSCPLASSLEKLISAEEPFLWKDSKDTQCPTLSGNQHNSSPNHSSPGGSSYEDQSFREKDNQTNLSEGTPSMQEGENSLQSRETPEEERDGNYHPLNPDASEAIHTALAPDLKVCEAETLPMQLETEESSCGNESIIPEITLLMPKSKPPRRLSCPEEIIDIQDLLPKCAEIKQTDIVETKLAPRESVKHEFADAGTDDRNELLFHEKINAEHRSQSPQGLVVTETTNKESGKPELNETKASCLGKQAFQMEAEANEAKSSHEDPILEKLTLTEAISPSPAPHQSISDSADIRGFGGGLSQTPTEITAESLQQLLPNSEENEKTGDPSVSPPHYSLKINEKPKLPETEKELDGLCYARPIEIVDQEEPSVVHAVPVRIGDGESEEEVGVKIISPGVAGVFTATPVTIHPEELTNLTPELSEQSQAGAGEVNNIPNQSNGKEKCNTLEKENATFRASPCIIDFELGDPKAQSNCVDPALWGEPVLIECEESLANMAVQPAPEMWRRASVDRQVGKFNITCVIRPTEAQVPGSRRPSSPSPSKNDRKWLNLENYSIMAPPKYCTTSPGKTRRESYANEECERVASKTTVFLSPRKPPNARKELVALKCIRNSDDENSLTYVPEMKDLTPDVTDERGENICWKNGSPFCEVSRDEKHTNANQSKANSSPGPKNRNRKTRSMNSSQELQDSSNGNRFTASKEERTDNRMDSFKSEAPSSESRKRKNGKESPAGFRGLQKASPSSTASLESRKKMLEMESQRDLKDKAVPPAASAGLGGRVGRLTAMFEQMESTSGAAARGSLDHSRRKFKSMMNVGPGPAAHMERVSDTATMREKSKSSLSLHNSERLQHEPSSSQPADRASPLKEKSKSSLALNLPDEHLMSHNFASSATQQSLAPVNTLLQRDKSKSSGALNCPDEGVSSSAAASAGRDGALVVTLDERSLSSRALHRLAGDAGHAQMDAIRRYFEGLRDGDIEPADDVGLLSDADLLPGPGFNRSLPRLDAAEQRRPPLAGVFGPEGAVRRAASSPLVGDAPEGSPPSRRRRGASLGAASSATELARHRQDGVLLFGPGMCGGKVNTVNTFQLLVAREEQAPVSVRVYSRRSDANTRAELRDLHCNYHQVAYRVSQPGWYRVHISMGGRTSDIDLMAKVSH